MNYRVSLLFRGRLLETCNTSVQSRFGKELVPVTLNRRGQVGGQGYLVVHASGLWLVFQKLIRVLPARGPAIFLEDKLLFKIST